MFLKFESHHCISAKIDLCVANWNSIARDIIDFSYFPNLFCFSLSKVNNRSRGLLN